jgi:GNAT superfamily N-acetyltransferase
MVRLDKGHYLPVYENYRSGHFFFPLIGAVLLDEQDGVVFADNAVAPKQIYVEHAFGFAQMFGESCPSFEETLERYLLIDKKFSAPKARLYAPCLPTFLSNPKYDSLRSFRQRFLIDPPDSSEALLAGAGLDSGLDAVDVDARNLEEIGRLFDVVSRFWRSPEDFIRKAHAVVASYRGQPACICYAAAEADLKIEIDVLTLPEYRNRGAGKFAVTHFVKRCFEQSLQPLWDCFTNNTGSMRLCRSIGFTATHPPYPFFTINRQPFSGDRRM